MPGPAPGPGQASARRPHDPRMRGADPRAQPRPVQQPQVQPQQAQPQQSAAANLPAEQQKGTALLHFFAEAIFAEQQKDTVHLTWFGAPYVGKSYTSSADGL